MMNEINTKKMMECEEDMINYNKIEEIKQNFKNYVENNLTFYDYFSPYPISAVSASNPGVWERPTEEEAEMRDSALCIGDFISEIEDDFEKETIATIIYVNGIDLSTLCSYALPRTEKILEALPTVKEGLKNKSLTIEVREEINVPISKEKTGTETFEYGDVTVKEIYDAYVKESPYYKRKVIWKLSVFR